MLNNLLNKHFSLQALDDRIYLADKMDLLKEVCKCLKGKQSTTGKGKRKEEEHTENALLEPEVSEINFQAIRYSEIKYCSVKYPPSAKMTKHRSNLPCHLIISKPATQKIGVSSIQMADIKYLVPILGSAISVHSMDHYQIKSTNQKTEEAEGPKDEVKLRLCEKCIESKAYEREYLSLETDSSDQNIHEANSLRTNGENCSINFQDKCDTKSHRTQSAEDSCHQDCVVSACSEEDSCCQNCIRHACSNEDSCCQDYLRDVCSDEDSYCQDCVRDTYSEDDSYNFRKT